LFLLIAASPASKSEAAYKRIVSLYPGHTDNIIALGGISRLVGVSKNDDADAAGRIPAFSISTGAEALLALHPDLVLTRSLADRQNPNLKNILERAGVRVFVVDPPDWDGFPGYLRSLAVLIGADPEKASASFESIKNGIKSEAEKYKGKSRKKVFIEATSKELHTCAPDSWAAHMVELAGGENIAKEAAAIRKGSAIAPWGIERILKNAGRIDVYIVQQGTMNTSDLESVRQRSWYPAIKNADLAAMPESLLSRPSLLGLKKGGSMLIKILYGSR